jgi:N-acetylmuramoyl-L-alanine amidase
MLNALGFDSGKEDGFYGPRTDGALRLFQRNVGDEPDGIVGPHTLSVLRRMRPLDAVPSRALVREREELEASRGPIEGRIIAVDVGEGSDAADDVHQRSALALVEELRAVGADPRLLVTDGEAAAPSDRARLANQVDAAAFITVELTARDEEGGGGPVCSFFGSRTTHSPSGLVLAQLILEELEAELGLSGRVRPLTIAPLRETRMPAVQVEPLTGTGEREEEMLRDPALATRVARAVAAGVGRFFSG